MVSLSNLLFIYILRVYIFFTLVVPEAISNMQTPQAGNLVPIGLDSVQCNGREGSLSECHSVTYVEGCTHVHDVGVNCTPTIGKLGSTVQGEFRLYSKPFLVRR